MPSTHDPTVPDPGLPRDPRRTAQTIIAFGLAGTMSGIILAGFALTWAGASPTTALTVGLVAVVFSATIGAVFV